jgi:hypothetical protein
MNLTIISFSSLVVLYALANFCGFVVKIQSDWFYAPFHLVGGALTFLFFHSFLPNYVVCLFLTEAVGILWEVYEWLLWKYFLKKKIYKPQADDTRNDLILDFAGALLIGILLMIIG